MNGGLLNHNMGKMHYVSQSGQSQLIAGNKNLGITSLALQYHQRGGLMYLRICTKP